jgi:hypothetical protein
MGFSGRLNTAFIERVNLTVRHGVAALRVAHGPQRSPPHTSWLICNGGEITLILCVPMATLRETLGSRKSEVASWWRKATGNVPQLGSGENQPTVDMQEVFCYPLSPVP